MRFIQGEDRTQTHLFPISLDQSIAKDNEVRLVDLFVDSLDLNDFGFKAIFPQDIVKAQISVLKSEGLIVSEALSACNWYPHHK